VQIRPLQPPDLDQIAEIDATAHSTAYLHVEQSGDALAMQWKVSQRPLREPRVLPLRLTEDALFTARQIASGHTEGLAVVTELRDSIAALALAAPLPDRKLLQLLDLRVDFDLRREGLGTALMYQVLQDARDREYRAVLAQTTSDNIAAAHFLARLGFKLSGIDTQHHTNHDLVKEQATLIWYAPTD
jgi:ribosomal protein S18 acetylase RimI-like enzyme